MRPIILHGGPSAAGATRARDQVQVVVHARRLAQHAEHAALTRLALRRRLLPRVGRIGRRLEGADWPTDVVNLHVASSAEAARARRALLRHDWVSSAGLERRFSYRRPLTSGRRQQRPRRMPRDYVTTALNASHWWRQGATGRGVRVAIFDTGLNGHHPFASHVVEMVDFTGERTTDDRVGHSTFMTGTIGSHAECAGFAPGAELTIVRVFDSTQRSTTAWFLEGFNFALHRRFDLVNLAVGGPDFRDAPFASKVCMSSHISSIRDSIRDSIWAGVPQSPSLPLPLCPLPTPCSRPQVRELARAGITIVSGVGNSGPGWGSLLNPADDALVIGVSGLLPSGRKLAPYASRGPTLWELPHGAGRMGVDVAAPGEFWAARSYPPGGCQYQWGTSVACPVVVGVLALLLSSLPPAQRAVLRSPVALKQALHASSERLSGASYLEQVRSPVTPACVACIL